MTNDKYTKILPITLLGLALRLYKLTYHSVWFDEAISIRWARSSAPRILEVSMNLVEDRLPPLYYLLLKWWVGAVGLSDFSVRYLSVVFGVTLIPVLYVLGWKLFSRRAGLLAALLAALNPFLIWYSQEARMYSLAALLGALGALCFVMGITLRRPAPSTSSGQALSLSNGSAAYSESFGKLRRALVERVGGRRPYFWWLGLGLCATAGLYTHLYTGFLWPALAIWLLLNPRYLKRYWLHFGIAMGAAAVLFLPLAIANWRFSGESIPGNPLANVWGRALDLFKAFVIWQAPLPPPALSVVIVILGAFLILGILVSLRNRATWLLLLLPVTPFAIASLLLLRSNLAFFGYRYFIVMLPWVLLLQALGVAAIGGRRSVGEQVSRYAGRRLGRYAEPVLSLPKDEQVRLENFGGLLAFVLVAATAIAIPGQWTVEASKEAWRQTTAYMTTHVQPDEAIFIHPEWIRFPFQYYAAQMKTPGQTYAAFFAVDDQTDLDGPLTGAVGEHPVVWLLQSHLDEPDPARRVENWFAARYPLVTELYPPGVTLKAYAPGYQLDALPPEATPIGTAFSPGLRLEGVEIFDTQLTPNEALFHPPSNWIHVTLYWSAAGTPASDDAAPYIYLVDDLGQVWGASLERANDALDFYPPSRWESGQVIRQDVDVNLNPAAPPGMYRLLVGIGDESVIVGSVVLVEE